jgi:cytochrome c biogenesis protein CcmG, thiol:disulfide interchange protein DsbE
LHRGHNLSIGYRIYYYSYVTGITQFAAISGDAFPATGLSNFARLDSRERLSPHKSFLAILLLITLCGCYTGSRPPRIGSSAPDFTVQDSDRTVMLNQFRGQIVVLNFWATWCPPCVEEMPSLVEMQRRMKAKGVTVVAVSIDEDEGAYRAFLKQHGVDLLTVRDPAQKTSALYGTRGWPETFVIDRRGVMRRKFIGAVDWTEPEITDFLSKL